MNFSYPIDGKINPNRPFELAPQYGYYPIGYYHCWHGGIHIEGGEKTEIKAMADGKIIAFRDGENIEVGTGKGGKKIFVSNSFVLIEHNYESSGGNKITFYSLYHHLSFGQEQEKTKDNNNSKKQIKIESDTAYAFKGIYGYKDAELKKDKIFIPNYTQIKLDDKHNKLSFTDGKDNLISDVYIKEEDRESIKENGKIVGKIKKGEGILLYKETSIISQIKTVIPTRKDNPIVLSIEETVFDSKRQEWYKVSYNGFKGFILQNHLTTKPTNDSQVQETSSSNKELPVFLSEYKNKNKDKYAKNKVITCDIDVKAGELIGYVGKQGVFNTPDYAAAHIEVFTENKSIVNMIIDLITNQNKKNGKNEKYFLELKEGDKLPLCVTSKLVISKGLRVEILEEKDDFVKVKQLQDLKEYSDNLSRWGNDDDLMFFEGTYKMIENLPLSRQPIFWIKKVDLGYNKNKQPITFRTLSEVYVVPPPKQNTQKKLEKNVIFDIRNRLDTVRFNGETWYLVEAKYQIQRKEITHRGWINASRKDFFSARNWYKFGFRAYDAEKHRMYPIQGVNNDKETSKFIEKMITLLDGQTKDDKEKPKKDGKIQNEELQVSYNKHELYEVFSKMVCLHKSEWSYTWDEVKKDAEAFFNYHYPNNENEAFRKKRLKELEQKYNAVYDFWGKLKFKTDTFWYFHPFAWVEQMKRVFGVSKWRDPVDNPQRTYYNSGGYHKEQNGAFGMVRLYDDGTPKAHQGLDLFTDINTPCYACLDGEIVSYSNESSNGYGNVLVLKVSGDDLRNAKNNYKLEFNSEIEKGEGFDIDASEFFLRYAHLSSAVKTTGKVKLGELIAYTGDTGNAKDVPNPHLHFEIAMKKKGNGFGLVNRYNPAFFVKLVSIDKKLQEDVKNRRQKEKKEKEKEKAKTK